MSWGKHKKVQNFFYSNRKKLGKLIKENENIITITYKLKFIDSATFMATSLSNLVDNLTKDFTRLKIKIVIFFLSIKMSRII